MTKSPQKIRITMYTWEPPVGWRLHCTASQLEIKLVFPPSGGVEGAERERA